ncbi:MAG: hypothetical protein J0G36_22095 [Afipia sp.]|nr:hypothetical protein [Afipia sp.]
MSISATLFVGPDMEGPPTVRRETIYFEQVEDAIIHAVEKLSMDRQYGAYIKTSDGDRIEMDNIRQRYKAQTK